MEKIYNGGVLTIYKNILDDISNKYIETLWDAKPSEKGKIVIYGKECREGRYNSLYTLEPNIVFNYSNKLVKSSGEIKEYKILRTCYKIASSLYKEVNFNAAFVNWYENGEDYVGPHSDDTKELVKDTPILSFTFYLGDGENRLFCIHEIDNKKIIDEIEVENGDILVMSPNFQKCVKHSIKKGKRRVEYSKRINVTMRSFK